MIDSEEDDDRLSVSSEDDSSEEGEDEKVPFEIGDSLKRVLEKDFELITKRNKVSISMIYLFYTISKIFMIQYIYIYIYIYIICNLL